MAQTPMKIRRVDFYAADWLEGTAELKDDERGVYITAVALIYARGGPITKELLKASCSSHGNSFNRIISRLETLGKLIGNGREIDQKRCGNELEKARKRIDSLAKIKAYEPRESGTRATPPSTINHQPAFGPLRDPTEIAKDLGLRK